MTKEELIKAANGLYQEALEANAYYALLIQYDSNRNKYYEEMAISSAFYGISFMALQRSLFMELAKLFDKSKDVISVGQLLKLADESIALFPQYRLILETERDGKKHTTQIPFEHQLRKTEECFFKNEVESQRNINRILGIENADSIPITIKLKFSDYIELYKKELHSLRPQIDNLTIQRNKIYAHNDGDMKFDFETIYEKYSINYSDIKVLIDFSLDVTRLIIGVLTGVNKAEQYTNIDDWVGTLRLVQIGNKYKDVEIASHMKT